MERGVCGDWHSHPTHDDETVMSGAPGHPPRYHLGMGTIQPHRSPELLAELKRASAFHDFVMKSFPDSITPADDRVNMLAAQTHLADDLFGSILYLISAGGPYDGGAFALVRPLVEVSVEAQWQFLCANDETFRRAYAGEDVDPGLPNMMDELDKYIGDPVFAGLRANVKVLHGFTHGGIEQLGRRFDAEGNLRATYTDKEKFEVLRVGAANFALLSSIFCQAAFGMHEMAASSAAIEAKYQELYGAGGCDVGAAVQ